MSRASAPGSTTPRPSGAPGAPIYYDDDGRTLGSMQYGPAVLFPRAWELPAGPPSEDAALITCAYLVDRATPWVLQSLFLAAIGDAKDKRAKALETFAYRYAEGESAYERFLVHRTVFPAGLSLRLRLRDRAPGGADRARPARPRRLAADRRGQSRQGAAGRQGGVRARAGAGASRSLVGAAASSAPARR